MADSPLPDGSDWWMEALFWIGVVPLVVLAVSMLFVQMNPGAPWQLEAAYSTTVGSLSTVDVDDPNTSLKISQTDAEYLNRIYRELDGYAETGYCINLVGDEMRVSKAATLEADRGSVTFSTANCFSTDGIIHTHPPDSRPVLSGPDTSVGGEEYNDKKTFLNSDFDVSCVQAGLMSTEVGSNPIQLKCYSKPGSGDIGDEFPLVGVTVVE